MALKITVKDTEFGVGDKIRVVQKVKDADGKGREAFFEGMVLGIKGREPGKTFMVRKIAEGGIGVERIFPVNMPSIERIIVVKKGVEGVKRAKLYYTRSKAPSEIEMIFKKAAKKNLPVKPKAAKKKAVLTKKGKKSKLK